MTECIFCSEEVTRDNEILRSELFRARWDAYPVTPGHAEIVPLRHVQFFDQLNDDELREMMVFGRQVIETIRTTNLVKLYETMLIPATAPATPFVESALKKARAYTGSPEGFNLGINDGPVAGQSVSHLHLHLMPRWTGDVKNPRGGVRNIFPNDEYGEMR